MAISNYLAEVWSATQFQDRELAGYAEAQIEKDTRLGVQIMAGLALLMQACVAFLLISQEFDPAYINTNFLLAALSLHILISAGFIKDVRTLHFLGMTFLVIGALAITFLAHRTGDLNIGTMAAIILLFVAIPLVPWALREATLVIVLTYLLLTSSLASVPGRFDSGSFWVLQLLVLGAAIICIVITGRNTFIRRHDIRARFELEHAHRGLELLSMRDHLTKAWNRRFLQERFPDIAKACRDEQQAMHIAVLDIDDFKGINDHYGHQVGDWILVSLSEIFIRHIGDRGYLVRLGGDEFLIIYRGEGLDALIELAIADLQCAPVAHEFKGKRTITLSAGIVSSKPGDVANLEEMYQTADRALYGAKNNRPSPRRSEDQLARTGTWKI